MPVYNKLVRDNIPNILQEKGKGYVGKTAENKEEFLVKLKEKLQEEVSEFLETPCAEEIADIQEVLDALAFSIGSDVAEVATIKEEKATNRGRFYTGYILWSVED
jgi:predicted house-cleaning noncanonical NTP pyrophosphatase (MazG superfamily)